MSRVLVVHADAAVGSRLTARLSEAGLEARVVTSGERAMDRFIQEPTDVVVIDYHLEGRDGVSTAEAIRWMPGGRRARLILTAAREPDEGPLAELARSVDPFMVVVAPPDGAHLRAVVERAAAERPPEAETRILAAEDALLAEERARAERPPLSEASRARVEIRQASLLDDEQTFDEPPPADWEFADPDGTVEAHEVRELADAVRDTHSAMVGGFDRTSFGRLLHRLAEKRATGALICVHPPDERATTGGTEPTKVVYFRSGVPVHVRSNLVDECLGQVLTRQNKIGRDALKASIEAMRRGEGRQGELLVSMGAIAPMELSAALADQLRRKLFELFGWRRGTFRFALGRPPPRELIDLEMGLAEIAVFGVRQEIEPARARSLLEPSRQRFAIPNPRKMIRFVQLRLEPALRELVLSLDGSQRVGDLIAQAPTPAPAAQLLYAMECLEAVRFSEEPLRRAPAPVRAVDELPSIPGAAVLRSDSSEAQPLSLGEAHLSSVDLGVESGGWGQEPTPIHARPSGPAALEKAPESLGPPEAVLPATGARRVPPSGLEARGDQPTPATGLRPNAMLALSAMPTPSPSVRPPAPSPPIRESERPTPVPPASTAPPPASTAPPPAATPVPHVDPGPLLLGSQAPAQPETADDEPDDTMDARPIAARATSHAPPEVDARAVMERVAQGLADASAETPLAESLQPVGTPAMGPPAQPTVEPTAPPPASPPTPEADAEALDDRVGRLLAAERHARRGQRALERGRAKEALDALEKAVSLCPDEAHLIALGALARHRLQPDDAFVLTEALAETDRACALSPDQALAHGLRSMLLRAADRIPEAEAAHAAALALEPGVERTLESLET